MESEIKYKNIIKNYNIIENNEDNTIQSLSIMNEDNQFDLADLPYQYDALEPFLDEKTLKIHHSKHHKSYVSNLNNILKEWKDVPTSIENIIKNISNYPQSVRNNAGGHYNHSLFWKTMTPKGDQMPSGDLLIKIIKQYKSFENFSNMFSNLATKHFASGWAWLVVNNGNLEIGTTKNHDCPLMDNASFQGTPILTLDLWEHAYYLQYQNKRADYINAWWNVIDWDEVCTNYHNADL